MNTKLKQIKIKISPRNTYIDEYVFKKLLNKNTVLDTKEHREYYNKALKNKEITFINLKKLSERADIPYCLLFGNKDTTEFQIKRYQEELEKIMPKVKEYVSVAHRGAINYEKIESIVKDLSRKQILLKQIKKEVDNNPYIGSLKKEIKKKSIEEVAKFITDYFDIDFKSLRKKTTKHALNYITEKIESKNIYISNSSHNYMPIELDRTLRVSGFCVRDRKFPFIFINNRDGDENPIIFENDTRQIFTLLSMVVAIGLNEFVFNNTKKENKKPRNKIIFKIVGEMLIPEKEAQGIAVSNLQEVSEIARLYKVSKSMLVFRLSELNKISKTVAENYYNELSDKKVKENLNRSGGGVKSEQGYLKYNGKQFSIETLSALNRKEINIKQASSVLFKKQKPNTGLLTKYKTLLGI